MTAGHHVQMHDVQFSYGRRSVLAGADLELEPGDVVALLGPNGCGKTTLMKVLVGLLTADSGTIVAPHGNDVGWVPQGGAVYQRLTVRENLELFARLLDLPGDPRLHARAAAETAQLDDWWNTLAADLSGGLRQRLNLAVGLLGSPGLLVLDEPTTGVDLAHRSALFHVLRGHAAAGRTILFSTHSLEDAQAADRAAVLVDGRIVWSGPVRDLALLAPDDEPGAAAELGTQGWESAAARGLLSLWHTGHEQAVPR